MIKRDLNELLNNLSELNNLSGAKFSYVILKNKALIETDIKLLTEVNKQTETYQKFEFDRFALCEKYCEKDENGKAVLVNNYYKIIDRELFEIEMKQLTDMNQQDIIFENNRIKSFENLLNENVDIEFLKLKISDIPENITVKQMDIIKDFIE